MNLPDFPRYEHYKDSGVSWLGEIPAHWEVKRLKYFGKIFAGLNGKKGTDFNKVNSDNLKPYIPFTNIYNNRIISDEQYDYVNIKEWEFQNIVKKNDILFLMSSETIEDIAKCSIYLGNTQDLYLNSFCKGFRINKCGYVFPEYLSYLLSGNIYRRYFSICSRGFTRINLKQEFITETLALVPPFIEQITIADFLNNKVVQIDRAIAQKEKLIALLQERRQLLIHQAVTRGLNPHVPMKDSGVAWIGKIPSHWEAATNFCLFEERNEPGNDKLPLLSVSIHTAVSSEEISDEDNIRGRVKIEDKRSYKLVRPDDIAFNMMRAWQGAIGAVQTDGMVSPAYIVAKPKRDICSAYFEHLFRTSAFIQQMDRHSKGITDFRKRLYWNEFKRLTAIFPPYEEQRQIAEYIGNLTVKIDTAIARKYNEIEKLKEYKATLINSAVTGKIKIPAGRNPEGMS